MGTGRRPRTMEQAHEALCRVDPAMAQRLHPHNARKVRRALEFFRAALLGGEREGLASRVFDTTRCGAQRTLLNISQNG